ncbi:uncharacterized protein LOC130966969 [Arachis stenosperma]|uniref:uncharacterized protein LOC130966969 n=1 Tax=Arachis stenosperma TaxID=217475 RepID=UPI0025AB97AE|nr:uncharacterized protein LOC130966969 [Arachis stenosperma]
MFAFTSLGGKVLDSVNDGSGPPQFIITGQNYHRIGSLLPDPGQKPKFAQLYIYDTQHEIMHRQRIFRQTSEIDKELITELLQMIDTHNVIAQSFRRVREFYQCHPSEIFSLKLYSHRKVDRRTYNTPSCDEVAALIVGDFDSSDHGCDIIVRSTAGMYTIEFQKRGLPHAHMLLWLNEESNLQSVEIVDEFICAELPNPLKFPALYNVVTKYMIHGPYGRLRPSSPCMKDGKCSKFYPKRFVDQTSFDEDGYPIYRRRNMGVTVKINNVDIDNRFVVPYNPQLLMKYQAHINLEFYNKSNINKYLFKYINKGPDRVTATVRETYHVGESSQVVDEIKQYYDCRYSSPSESMWRIFAYDIHHRWPSVQRLTFQLPNQQHVVFDDADITTHIYLRNKDLLTMFTGWMMANRRFSDGRSLTYVEYPGKFVYCSNSREWKPRQRGFSIGRLSFAHPSSGELFYMRMLLNVQRGCTSFRSIRTVNGVTYDTFQEACSAMGFLIDDKEYVSTIKEVAEVASATQLRKPFVMLLLSGSMGRPLSVWEQTWAYLSDDILYRRRHELQYPDLTMSQDELQTFFLLEIEKLLQSNGKSLRNYADMPVPNNSLVSQFSNLMLLRELQYDTVSLTREHDVNVLKLNEEQRVVYDKIIDCVSNKRVLSARLRSEKRIVINVASSGIASLLLPGGKTAHSMFNIPVELTEDTVCKIKKDSAKAEVIRMADLIIWDEAPMTNKLAFEALDKT